MSFLKLITFVFVLTPLIFFLKSRFTDGFYVIYVDNVSPYIPPPLNKMPQVSFR